MAVRGFLRAAVERDNAKDQAWLAFDQMRHAAPSTVCKAHHVAEAVTTYRALWLKINHHHVYASYAAKFIDPEQTD